MDPRFFDRNKVPRKRPGQPHGVKIEISHDDRQMSIQQLLRNQMGNDAGRHEMSANSDMRIKLPDKFYQWTRVQAIEHQPHAVRFPRLITLLVPPPEELRSVLNQARVELRIEIAK